jgi:hypothetical protein
MRPSACGVWVVDAATLITHIHRRLGGGLCGCRDLGPAERLVPVRHRNWP